MDNAVNNKLDGKVALITGAGRGIGRAAALKLAAEGARVVVNDLDDTPANDVVSQIRSQGGDALAFAGSVTADDFAERFVGAAMQHYGGLDIVVNNAGYTWDNVIQKTSDEQWQAVIDCHLTAPFRILRAAQPVIRQLSRAEAEAGRRVVRKVVNVSSVSGLFGNAGQVNYSAAKAGIVGMTMTLAKEWGRLNTTVNCVAFGFIDTRLTAATTDDGNTANIEGREIKFGISKDTRAFMETFIPLGRAGTPEEAAGAIYLLCVPESDYVSGQTLLCSGGLTGI
jgi:3-oxoacyl-[acyl-carrier protein] reductase